MILNWISDSTKTSSTIQTISKTPQHENGKYFIVLPDELKDRELIIQIILKAKIEN